MDHRRVLQRLRRRRAPRRIDGRVAIGGVGGVAAALAARRLWRSTPATLTRMSGTSTCAPDAVAWVTAFLNDAYFAHDEEQRDVEDLRIAFAILTTRWHQLGHERRLHAKDARGFQRAFFRERWLDGKQSPRGALDGEQLLTGAERLIGPWFREAYLDDERRAHGIVFETQDERDAFDPEVRRRHAKLGRLTPPDQPREERAWHTYDPVAVASGARTLAALARPETWPDYASDHGRFTSIRKGGLAGQTFEIEVINVLAPRAPTLLRGYVSVTRLLTREDHADELDGYAAELNELMVSHGEDQPPVFPTGCTPLAAINLDTHEGHFMGRGRNRLVVYEHEGQDYLRAAGSWDDMPPTLDQAYRAVGREAQRAFWGGERPQSSMLHQIARRTGDG